MSITNKIKNSDEQSKRFQKLEEIRAPIIVEVLAENPRLTKEKLTKMMEEMGF
jgi:hypothetical protein